MVEGWNKPKLEVRTFEDERFQFCSWHCLSAQAFEFSWSEREEPHYTTEIKTPAGYFLRWPSKEKFAFTTKISTEFRSDEENDRLSKDLKSQVDRMFHSEYCHKSCVNLRLCADGKVSKPE